METSRKVLVTGVTGQQGGSVARALLSRGHRVRGLTRNGSSPAAKQLESNGVEIAEGDFTNPESLVRAADGVDTLFAMTTPFETGVDAETRQGLVLLDAAGKAGVGHLVYSSVSDADRETGIPHFDSKYQVEKAIYESSIPYTIIAPVYFMDNLLQPWIASTLSDGFISMAMPGSTKLQQIAVSDIGAFAAAVIEQREQVYGQRFNIAGDELSNDEVVGILSELTGKTIRYQSFPAEQLRAHDEDMGLMFEWFDDTGYSADSSALRTQFPDVSPLSFRDWASAQDWSPHVG